MIVWKFRRRDEKSDIFVSENEFDESRDIDEKIFWQHDSDFRNTWKNQISVSRVKLYDIFRRPKVVKSNFFAESYVKLSDKQEKVKISGKEAR